MEDNWLELLKIKFVDVDKLSLQQLLISKAEIMDEVKRSQDQRLNEDETKINNLLSKLAVMKETLYTETHTLEHKNEELLKKKAYLKELEIEKKKILQEIKQLEGKRNNLKSTKPNVQDQQVLEQGRKKLKLYKDLTGIQWDYEATKHGVKGYISNKHNYIRHFCYENQEINNELIDSLWYEIYLSAKAIKNEGETKDENLQLNINN